MTTAKQLLDKAGYNGGPVGEVLRAARPDGTLVYALVGSTAPYTRHPQYQADYNAQGANAVSDDYFIPSLPAGAQDVVIEGVKEAPSLGKPKKQVAALKQLGLDTSAFFDGDKLKRGTVELDEIFINNLIQNGVKFEIEHWTVSAPREGREEAGVISNAQGGQAVGLTIHTTRTLEKGGEPLQQRMLLSQANDIRLDPAAQGRVDKQDNGRVEQPVQLTLEEWRERAQNALFHNPSSYEAIAAVNRFNAILEVTQSPQFGFHDPAADRLQAIDTAEVIRQSARQSGADLNGILVNPRITLAPQVEAIQVGR